MTIPNVSIVQNGKYRGKQKIGGQVYRTAAIYATPEEAKAALDALVAPALDLAVSRLARATSLEAATATYTPEYPRGNEPFSVLMDEYIVKTARSAREDDPDLGGRGGAAQRGVAGRAGYLKAYFGDIRGLAFKQITRDEWEGFEAWLRDEKPVVYRPNPKRDFAGEVITVHDPRWVNDPNVRRRLSFKRAETCNYPGHINCDHGKFSAQSRRALYIIMMAFGEFGVGEEWCGRHPLWKVGKTKELRKRERSIEPVVEERKVFWTVPEQERFLQIIKGDYMETAYRLGLKMGLRKGELLALPDLTDTEVWEDLDGPQPMLNIGWSFKMDEEAALRGSTVWYIGKTPKSHDSMGSIPIPLDELPYLREQQERMEIAERLFGPFPKVNRVGGADIKLLFRHFVDGDWINPGNFTTRFKVVCKRVAVKPITFHDTRRTMITTAFADGLQDKVVQGLARHANSETTQLYNAVDKEALSAAANRARLKREGATA